MFFTHTGGLTADEREQLVARAIGVVDGPVARLVVEDDRLHGVELEDGRVVLRDAVFVRPAFTPNSDLLTGLGCATHENGWVVADPTGRTTVPGVWVAGNAVNPRAQVITAAGEGVRRRHRDQRRPRRRGRAGRRPGLPCAGLPRHRLGALAIVTAQARRARGSPRGSPRVVTTAHHIRS